jgi:parallel beta-helix repeat protein
MKTSTLTIACALGILGTFFIIRPSPSLLAQGALTPPGAPAPTMKTLNQIEPRTPISALPFTISAPGSYYLTGNLTATADGTAITVSADYVTIDLNGFTLAGGATGTRTGIQAPAAQKGLCVRNGTLTGWTNHGINGVQTTGGLYENLRLTANSGSPALRSGTAASVRACVATGNTAFAAFAIALSEGSSISDCTVSSNGKDGISATINCTITNCTASGNGTGISSGTGIFTAGNCTVLNCTASGNSDVGLRVAGNGCTIAHCTASSNNGPWGIQMDDEGTITDCTAMGNRDGGMQAGTGCTISRCTVAKNGNEGLWINNRCHVNGCTFETNNLGNIAERPGLSINGGGNRIDGNHFANNGFAGLKAYFAGNLIIRNTFSGAQYIVTNGNTVGPTVDLSAGVGTVNTIPAGANPWANIMF